MSTATARSCVLLVDVTDAERAALSALGDVVAVAAAELEQVLADRSVEVDLVVVGSGCTPPVSLVQRAHRAAPDAGIVLLHTSASGTDVRRQTAYAPGVPLDLLVLDAAGDVGAAVQRLREQVAERQRHRALLASLTRSTVAAVPAPQRPTVAALGSLLEHAPLGVLVADPQGRVLGWNRRAEALLELAPGHTGTSVDEVLPGAGALARSAAGLDAAAAPAPAIEVTGTVDVEVSAVASQLDDGRPVALLLLVDVSSRREAERARDRMAGHVQLLGQVSEQLSSSLDRTEALGGLSRTLVPALADWVSIQLTDLSGGLGLVTVHHRERGLAEVVEQVRQRQGEVVSERAPSRLALAGHPIRLTGLTDDQFPAYVDDPVLRELFAQLGVSSVLAVPLSGREAVLGSLVLVNAPGSRAFTEADLAVAVEVGRRAGIALDNMRLYTQQRELATELQRSLLTEPPQPDHGEIVVRYVAASQQAQVGGDWYDAFLQPGGATVLVIGDVVGHDTRAAAAMGQLRGLVRGIAYTTEADPAEVLSRTDAAIEGLLLNTTATAVVLRLEQTPTQRKQNLTRVRWSNAGHPPPVVVRPDGRVEVLEHPGSTGAHDEGDLLLGVEPSARRRAFEVTLPRGSTVLLYTDGLVERRGQSLDEGVAALTEVLSRHAGRSLDALCDTVLTEMLQGEPEDDVALVAVRLHRQDQPRPAEAGPQREPARRPRGD